MPFADLDDGSKLEAAWQDALNSSLSYFRALLSSSTSSAWKPVAVLPLTESTTAHDTGKSHASSSSSLGRITPNKVAVHRRNGKGGEVYRAVVDVDCGTDISTDTFRGCLVTPETRPQWDRMVEEAAIMDLLDANTRVTKTNYRLGWPSSPRDVVTISKTQVDRQNLIDITTSLPRSRHEPAYLRPCPPYVRAHIGLLAWYIQLPQPDIPEGKARITCFWSWNPKGAWAVGGGVPQHLPSLVTGLVDYVREGSEKVPTLLGYGQDISVGSFGYDTARVTLSLGYAVVRGEEDADGKRRQIEFGMSSTESWDVQIHVKTQHGEESISSVWTSFVGQAPAPLPGAKAPKRLVLRFAHAKLQEHEELVRVKVSIERTSSSSSGVRINGIPVTVETMDAKSVRRPLLEDLQSTSGISLRSLSTVDTQQTLDTAESRLIGSTRLPATERAIASMIKRNYIYFTSLLQEPEPKWRPVLDSRGVAIHQLNSIDKTLVVFRAEAVFVGVGIWDLYATIASPGGRWIWDKTHDDATLVEDVNELTDLWHFRSKAAWPVAARDSVMLRTTYKSPTSVHVFGFSVEDTELFPRIPPSIDPTIIRTQIDLQGWSIESLSPNTTHVTLLEQSDPRGWSNKSSIPQVMMTTLAGIGEFAIKHGAPPIATRLGGARALSSKYDVEKETFRFEYEAAESRRSDSSSTATSFPLPVAVRAATEEGDVKSLRALATRRKSNGTIECEIRCDMDQWATSIAVVIDPPQSSLSALKRHRLSAVGGGLWLTIEHNPLTLGQERVAVTIRRGLPAVKPTLTVNGTKVKIDTEELVEADVQLLKRQKRSRPTRAPLDQPPALGTIRKKQSTLELAVDPFKTVTPSTYAKLAAPLGRWYNVAAQQTKAAIVPMTSATPAAETGSTPVDAAIRALSQLARMHTDRDGESTDPNSWQPVSDRDGLKVERRTVNHISETFPVYRASRIIEGFTAEEVSAAVSSLRKDERFDAPVQLQSYGHGITVSHLTAHTSFPFRGRSMLVATVIARLPDGPPPSPSVHAHSALSTIFHASTSSFDPNVCSLDPGKYNTFNLPTGNLIMEGWVLETIDPYSHENYAIPSTRCMYVAAADYSGSMPLSVNNMLNAALPRVVSTIEGALKANGAPSRPRLPSMCILSPDARSLAPWSLEGVESERIGASLSNSERDFSMTVLLRPIQRQRNGDHSLSPSSPKLAHHDSRSSMQSGRSTVIDLAEEIRRGKRDLVVFEIELASILQKGCDISLLGVPLPMAIANNDTLSFTLPSDSAVELPFKCAIIALAPSVMQSASLEPSPARHLLRVTLPTTGYETPIADPLTGKTAPLPRPRWLLDLLNDGAAVQVSIVPKPNTDKYFFGNQMLQVEEEKRTNKATRETTKVPQLVNRETPNSVSLERPLVVATEYTSAAKSAATDSIKETPTPPGEPAEPAELTNGALGAAPKPALSVSTLEPPGTSTKYQFWKYPYPRLRRLTPSASTSVNASPVKVASAKLPVPAEVSLDSAATSPLSTTGAVQALSRRVTLSLPSLVVLCIVCFLLGSLLRSLLSEADFVIYFPSNVPAPEGENWRELQRLAQWKIGWRRDLVLAVARRQ